MITKDMVIGDCIAKYPDTIELFLENGMHCVGCSMMGVETIEMGLLAHGKSKEEIKQFIKDLNEITKNGS
jgi:hybrid cluster-associated redox disulfide protein